jgi:hypothetical protein
MAERQKYNQKMPEILKITLWNNSVQLHVPAMYIKE